jgi:F0F1-type ATP synthase membrane subunit b/b'
MVADIDTQVKQGIEVELQKAKTVLAVEAAILSVDLAEGKIKDKINTQDHERIVKEYIAKVGGKS